MHIRGGRWQIVAALAAIVLVGLALQPVTLLRVTAENGTSLLCRRVTSGSTVTLVFTHSMYGGGVRETWRIEGSALDRVRIETDNAAAAEYYASDGRVERTDTGFEVIAPPLLTESLVVRIDQIGRHRLRVGGEEIALSDCVAGSIAATMSVDQMALIAWVIGGDCRHDE